LYQGDCLEVMQSMPDNSVNLIATDPPYFKVKNEAWDRQWDKPEAFLEWIGKLCEQWHRILKPNGSLYVFASPRMAARVECKVGEWFHIINRITWRKPPFATKAEMFRKETLRSYFPASEAIIFADHGPVWSGLLEQERIASGKSRQAISEEITGNRSGACWNWEAGIRFPKQQHWERLRELYVNLPPYEEIERPFNVTADVPYTDVWDFPTVKHYPGKHPCEKPLEMMEHIVKASSRERDVVLDCFAGSGVTGEAALKHGRDFIGIEVDKGYCARIRERLEAVEPKKVYRLPTHTELTLFDEMTG
jgi:adenine-specific DNA-methyltransferase